MVSVGAWLELVLEGGFADSFLRVEMLLFHFDILILYAQKAFFTVSVLSYI